MIREHEPRKDLWGTGHAKAEPVSWPDNKSYYVPSSNRRKVRCLT
jgi:hypothetical protein